MMTTDDDFERYTPKEKRRIIAERKALNLRPWQFSPSEVQDYACPHPDEHIRQQWAEASELWRQMEARKTKRSSPSAGE